MSPWICRIPLCPRFRTKPIPFCKKGLAVFPKSILMKRIFHCRPLRQKPFIKRNLPIRPNPFRRKALYPTCHLPPCRKFHVRKKKQPTLPQSESSRQMIHYRLRQQYACLPLLLPDRYHLPSRNRRFRTCLPVRIRNLPLQKENFPIPSDSSPVHQAANCLLRRPRTAGILLSRQRG